MPISTSKNYDEFSEEINKERGLSGRDSYEDGETKWYNMYDAMNVGFRYNCLRMKRFVTFLLLCYVCVSCSKNTDSMSLDIYVNDVKAERDINKYISESAELNGHILHVSSPDIFTIETNSPSWIYLIDNESIGSPRNPYEKPFPFVIESKYEWCSITQINDHTYHLNVLETGNKDLVIGFATVNPDDLSHSLLIIESI